MSSSFVIFLSLRDSLRCSVAIPFRFTDDNDKSSEISEIIFSRLSPSHCEQFAMVDDSPEHFFSFEVSLCVMCVWLSENPLNISYCSDSLILEMKVKFQETERKIGEISTVWVRLKSFSGVFVHVIQVHCCCGFVQDCPKTSRETTDIELLTDQDYSRNRKKIMPNYHRKISLA